ncbi:DegT/DnrJ/EryC1/StrS family aminotransferase [Kitasatospora sp. NPDC094028]
MNGPVGAPASGPDRVGAGIPLVDLAAAHAEVAAEVREGFDRVLASGAFVQGPEAAAFEREYADFTGVRHCVGAANGTDALELALRALDLPPGGGVVLPANTFVATAEAVQRAGLRPVLVDADPVHLLIDPARAAAALPGAVALLPVHLFGQLAPMDALVEVAAGRPVVEDAAQSQGARQYGRTAYGRIAATSFYPGKNLGAYGDAGAVLTDDPELADAVRRIGDHGARGKYRHERFGFNSRMDALQAVVLRAKLRRLPAWNAARRAAADRYHALLRPLADSGALTLPGTAPGNEHVRHLYPVRITPGRPPHDGRRDAVLAALRAAGIGAGVHYPVPVHLQPAFAHLGHRAGSFPVAERAARELLSLPLHPHLTERQQQRVVEELGRALGAGAHP